MCQLTYWCNGAVQCASLYCVGHLECSVPVQASINMLYIMVVMLVMLVMLVMVVMVVMVQCASNDTT